MQKAIRLVVILALALSVAAIVSAQDDMEMPEPLLIEAETGEWTMATVVKISGIAWFDRMEQGIEAFNEDYPNVTAFQQGPAQADAAQQVQVIEDILAQGVDALCVIPFQPDTVEPVLERAREEGVIVITHEASSQQNVDFDIEAFDNAAYGVHLMDALAERMGEEGEYTVFVGSLTSETHNQWVDAAIAHQEEAYPDMTFVGDKNESFDDATVAYERMQELLIAFPNLKGVQGSASTDVLGVGQAVEEAGLQDDIAVVGTGLANDSRSLIETGAIDLVSFWDPALAGYACNMLGLAMLEEQMPEAFLAEDAMLPEEGFGLAGLNEELPLEGYEALTFEDGVFFGQAWVDVTIDNVDDWNF
ncbi:MAG: substrate-binding domain-containing protein [Chloroflexota bacterium]